MPEIRMNAKQGAKALDVDLIRKNIIFSGVLKDYIFVQDVNNKWRIFEYRCDQNFRACFLDIPRVITYIKWWCYYNRKAGEASREAE